jgi:hypothetical protein
MVESGKIHVVDAFVQSLARDPSEAKRRCALLWRMPRCMPEECRFVWQQAAFSFIFEHDFGAIAVCGAFVECFLRAAIPVFEAARGQPPATLPDSLDRLINRAKSLGLITKQEANALHSFRQFVRNPHVHGNVHGIADSLMRMEKVTVATVKDGGVLWEELSPRETGDIREVTARARLRESSRMFAEPTMRWINQWSASCARKVWEPAGVENPPTSSAPDQ